MPFSNWLLLNSLTCFDDQSERQRKICQIPPPLFTKRKRAPYATSLIGSLTVEAAFVIPLLIVAFTSLIYIIQIMGLSMTIQSSLYEQSMKIAGYSYFSQQIEDKLLNKTKLTSDSTLISFVSNTISSEYVKIMVVDDIGADYLDNSCIVGGNNGINITLTPNVGKDIYDITLYYNAQVPLNWFGINSIRLASRAYVHMWTGDKQQDDKKEIVYMTHDSDVYHLYSDCSYISTKIYQTTVLQISELRNKSGSKYYACSTCCQTGISDGSSVYYTLYGTRYHTDNACSHIERNVIEVELDEVLMDKRVCSRCLKRSNQQ